MSRRPPPFTAEPLLRLEQVVAESLALMADEDRGWRRAGSRAAADRTLADLAAARDDARRLLEGGQWDDGNEFAIGASENRRNYVCGQGLKYEAAAAPGVTGAEPLVAQVNTFVSAFSELNCLPEMESETVLRWDRDGEAFVRLFPAGGIPEAAFVEPEMVYPPAAGGGYDGGHPCRAWGVELDPFNRRAVKGYWVDPGTGTPALAPEDEVAHSKLNVTTACARGWPTFDPVAKALRRCEELLVAMTATGKARAKIALIMQIPGWNKQKADQYVNSLTSTWQSDPAGGEPREVSTEDLPYGALFRVSDKTQVQFPSSSLGAADLVEAMQANLRAAGTRMNMPEWMFSGQASEKYANAFVGEGPTLKSFQRLQRKLAGFFGDGRLRWQASVIWRAVRLAVRVGTLPAAVLSAVRIKATAPSLEVRDKTSEASANSIYIDKKVKPVALVQQELGYDPAALKKLFAEETPPAPEPAPDPLAGVLAPVAAEHLERDSDGLVWVSEALYPFVAEADRSHLVLVEVTTKGGVTTRRWVNPQKKDKWDVKKKPAKQDREVAGREVRDALADPSKLTPAKVRDLAAKLGTMTVVELNALKKERELKGGRTKQDLIDRLVAHAKEKQAAKGKPPEPPAPVPVEKPKPAAKTKAAKYSDLEGMVGGTKEYDSAAFAAGVAKLDDRKLGLLASKMRVAFTVTAANREAVRAGVLAEAADREADSVTLERKSADWDAPVAYKQHRPGHPLAKSIAADAENRGVMESFLKETPAADRAVVDALSVHTDRARLLWEQVQATRPAEGQPETPEFQVTRSRWAEASGRKSAAADAVVAVAERARKRLADSIAAADPIPLALKKSPGVKSSDGKELIPPFEPTETQQKALDSAASWVSKVTESAGGSVSAEVQNSLDGRAYYSRGNGGKPDRIGMGVGLDSPTAAAYSYKSGLSTTTQTVVHELGHALENRKPGVRQAALEFLEYRLDGEEQTDLGDVPGGEAMKGEMGAKDRFGRHFSPVAAYYVGKQYGSAAAGNRATEVLSMGIETLFKNPAEFVKNDPEYAQFVISQLRRKS